MTFSLNKILSYSLVFTLTMLPALKGAAAAPRSKAKTPRQAKIIKKTSSLAVSSPKAGGGNVGSGNNGNGVGNTGPGNQGNNSTNGNAGGTNPGNGGSSGGNTGGNNGGGSSNSNSGGGNVGTGNSGNGVGNTGPGNQGNDSTNGNAGGTNPSNGGSSGGNTGGNNGGGSSNSNSGSSNIGTGNSGNGVGNTGPGNQGNDSTNGNAGGTNPGNGGSSGGNTGGNNGGGSDNSNSGGGNVGTGNNGNGVGNTGPGNQGNDSTNGNAGGTNPDNGGNSGGNNGNGVGNTGPGNQGNDSGNGNAGGTKPGNGGDTGGGDTGGGDTGGGDTGGGDTGGGDETKTSSPAQEKAKKRFVFDLTPLLYLDLDFSKKFVNLTPAAKSSDRQLVMDEYRDGFRFLQSRSIDFGVGAVGSWHYTNATGLERFFAAYVGVLPITGSKIFSDRFVQKKADAKKLPEPSIPYLAKDLDAWREGDQLSYFTHGGILFFGGAGVSPVTAGLAYLAEGQWTTTIVKLPEQKVYAKLSKTKLNSLSTSAGTALLVVSLSQFKNSDDMFSFVFDLRTASGALAYEDFLKGNIAAIQKMALTPESGVKQDLSSRGKRIGKLWSMWFGIPIFANVVGSQGTTYEAQHVLDGNDGTHTDVEYGIFMKERKTRLFFKHNNKTQAFFGTSYRQDSPVSGKTQGYFGKMVWNYENDNASDNNLRSNIDNLVTLTGLSQIKTEVPVVGKMNYVGIRFEMTIPQQTTDLLMSFAKNKETFVQIYGYAKALLDETFKGIENPDEMPKDLCNMEGFSANRCPEQYHQATAIALNDMYKSLRKMAKSKDKNSKDFVKAYGIFGRALLFNKFAFQSVMKALGNAPVDMVLNVEGERISKVTRVLRNSTVLK